jgi:hypothetical protein
MMCQAMMLTAPLKHLRHHRFLADMLVADVLDRDSRSRGQRRRLLAHLVTQRFGKLRVIEDAHVIGVEKFRHPIGVANRGQRSGDHHPVVARQHPGNPVVVAFQQGAAHGILGCCGIGRGCYTLFGSGFAGLGQAGVVIAHRRDRQCDFSRPTVRRTTADAIALTTSHSSSLGAAAVPKDRMAFPLPGITKKMQRAMPYSPRAC